MLNSSLYVADIAGSKFNWRSYVDCATTASITVNNFVGTVIDGFTVLSTSRVLVKNNGAQNGIYINNQFSAESFVSLTFGIYYVMNGATNGGKFFAGTTGSTYASIFVTSVGLTAPSIFSVSGSPITSAGNLTLSLNTFFAAPNGSTGTPTFRAITSADLPTFTQNSVIFAGPGGVLAQDNTNFTWQNLLLSATNIASSSGAFAAQKYSTGTVSASGTTITGIGTTFTAAMIGVLDVAGIFYFVSAVVSATSLTISTTASFSASSFALYYNGLVAASGIAAANNLYVNNLFDSTQSAGSGNQVLVSTGAGIKWQSSTYHSATNPGALTSSTNYPSYTSVYSFSVPLLSSGSYVLNWYCEFGCISNSAFIQISGSVSGVFGQAQNNMSSFLTTPVFQTFSGFHLLTSYTGSEIISINLCNGMYESIDPATVQNIKIYL